MISEHISDDIPPKMKIFKHDYPPGGGGTLIFLHTRRLGLFFLGQNSEFQYFLGVFRKINIFWGMKILWIFLGVITKLSYFEGHFYAF